MSDSQLFTAAEYAAKLGRKRQYVFKLLRHQAAAGEKIVRGAKAAAWSIGALPSPAVRRLAALATRQGFATPLDYMQSSVRPAALPNLCAIAPAEITRAQKLQRALSAALQLPIDCSISERARVAALDYAREFDGRTVSDRYLRKLIADVLQRDCSRREFSRLELYATATRRRIARTAPLATAFRFTELESAIASITDRNQPTIAEVAYCWRETVTMISDRIAAGADEIKLKQQLRTYIVSSAPFLGPTPSAAKRNINLKLRAAIDGGGVDAIADGRPDANMRRGKARSRFSADIKLLAHHTVFFCGKRESQAFRQLYEGTTHNGERFSEAFRAAVKFDARTAKSDVPKWVRAAVQPMVEAMWNRRLGPRAARLALPSIHRDWSNVLAGASYTSDDVTLNHYVIDWREDGEYVFDGRRFNVCRPQFLPVVDERTGMPLGFSLIAERGYSSRHIRTLMARICMRPEIGLPFEQFAFERGIWSARNVQALAAWPELDESFARYGVRLALRHATTPKAKIIEQVIGSLQNLDEFAPGYIGRGEQLIKHEHVQKFLLQLCRAGQPRKAEIDPRLMLMDMSQCEEMLASVMRRFADEPQNGKRLDGISPAEGWQQLSGGKAHVVLPESLRYLLGTDQSEQTVTREGIKLRIGRAYRYYVGSEQLGALVGERVRVRYNDELPELVTVTHIASDPRGLQPFSVPLFKELPAHGATAEQFAESREHQNRFASRGRALYRELAPRSNKTWSSGQLGSADMHAAGEAHNRLEREHVAQRDAELPDRRTLNRLGYDARKVRNPKRVLQARSTAEELRAQIVAEEAAAEERQS